MAGKTTQKHDERGGRYLDSYKPMKWLQQALPNLTKRLARAF